MVQNLNIKLILEKSETEPDFLDFFGKTEDKINDWKFYVEGRIWKLSFQAIKEFWDRKISVQTGLEKL